jgi:uncharacterized membrane protein YfcA
MGAEIARWMVALGVVAAVVGFTFIGMATSYVEPHRSMFNIGLVLLIGGAVGTLIGWFVHRAADEPDRSTP